MGLKAKMRGSHMDGLLLLVHLFNKNREWILPVQYEVIRRITGVN